jgi:hypothetical protein
MYAQKISWGTNDYTLVPDLKAMEASSITRNHLCCQSSRRLKVYIQMIHNKLYSTHGVTVEILWVLMN